MDPLDYVEPGFKRFSAIRVPLGSAGICGACCPISCPTRSHQPLLDAISDDMGALGADRLVGDGGAFDRVVEVGLDPELISSSLM